MILALVVLKKLELAALRSAVGKDLKKRCEYGRAFTGSAP